MEDILRQNNAWWETSRIDDIYVGIRRDAFDNLIRWLKAREIIALTGIRRAGKSTILFQLIDFLLKEHIKPTNILYANLDNPELLATTKAKGFPNLLETYERITNANGMKYIFLDEIQELPDWQSWLKSYYDSSPGRYKFIISGSSASLIKSKLSVKLAGRYLSYEIYPLSFPEFLRFNGRENLLPTRDKTAISHFFERYLVEGGFPEITLEKNTKLKHDLLRELYHSVFFRDIIESHDVKAISKFKDLVFYAVSNFTGMISYNRLSKQIGLSDDSIKEYLSYCEESFLVFQLGFFSYSLRDSAAIQKPRKLYCIDNGLRNAVSFRFSPDFGKLAENILFLELKRRGDDVFFWKDKNEVDFILKAGTLTAINSCYGDIKERETKGLLEFKEKYKKKVGKMYILTMNIEKVDNEIIYMPIWKFLMQKIAGTQRYM